MKHKEEIFHEVTESHKDRVLEGLSYNAILRLGAKTVLDETDLSDKESLGVRWIQTGESSTYGCCLLLSKSLTEPEFNEAATLQYMSEIFEGARARVENESYLFHGETYYAKPVSFFLPKEFPLISPATGEDLMGDMWEDAFEIQWRGISLRVWHFIFLAVHMPGQLPEDHLQRGQSLRKLLQPGARVEDFEKLLNPVYQELIRREQAGYDFAKEIAEGKSPGSRQTPYLAILDKLDPDDRSLGSKLGFPLRRWKEDSCLLNVYVEKKEFLEKDMAITIDPNAKFAIQRRVKEVQNEISSLRKKIDGHEREMIPELQRLGMI